MIWLWKFCLYFIIICKSNLQIRNFLWCFFVYNHDHLALLKHKLPAPALNSYDLLEPTNHIHDAIKLFAPFSINQTLPNSVTSIAQLPHTHTCIYDTRGHTFSAFSAQRASWFGPQCLNYLWWCGTQRVFPLTYRSSSSLSLSSEWWHKQSVTGNHEYSTLNWAGPGWFLWIFFRGWGWKSCVRMMGFLRRQKGKLALVCL